MELSEFLNRGQKEEAEVEEEVAEPEEIDVQKAVVESLAADKAEQDELIASLRKENEDLKAENLKLQNSMQTLQEQMKPMQEKIEPLQAEIVSLKAKLQLLRDELARMGDILTKNVDGEMSNKVSILERSVEIDDRFEGETRDHVIEVLREGRDEAEKNGRFRRAQILEAVLVNNEPTGELAKRRQELSKLFTENANVISGTVIEELKKRGISHKNGEEYLLPSEIIARNY